jgi:molybdopterin synthase sulfur carrier subunit
MAIDIMLSSALRRYVPDYDPISEMKLEAKPDLTALDLINSLGIPLEEVKIIMLNGKAAPKESLINDGDRVGLFPAVGGG